MAARTLGDAPAKFFAFSCECKKLQTRNYVGIQGVVPRIATRIQSVRRECSWKLLISIRTLCCVYTTLQTYS